MDGDFMSSCFCDLISKSIEKKIYVCLLDTSAVPCFAPSKDIISFLPLPTAILY